jgi:Holliday junction resolvasome RuvABC endonuclease subunit
MTRNNLVVLTNDPSFTAWGYAVIDNRGIVDSGCIKTAPEQKKRRIRASDDRTRRASEIVQALLQLIKDYNVTYILSEAPHGSQNANAAIMIGMVAGITTAIAECLDIPIEYYSEQDAKKAVLGKKAATKEDMIKAIDRLYEVDWTKIKYIDESVADAMAVYHVATKESQMLKMMRK